MTNQVTKGLAHDLVLVPVKTDGPGQVYQTNLWDIMRQLVTPDTSIDLLIGPAKDGIGCAA